MQTEQTEYIYLELAFVSAADQAAADSYASQLQMGPGNMSVPLSSSGAAPATFYGLCSRITEAQRAAIDQLIAAGVVKSLIYYRCDAGVGALLATNDPNVIASQQPWSWEQSLAALSLARIEEAP